MSSRKKSWIALSSMMVAGLISGMLISHSKGDVEKILVAPPPVAAVVTAPARALSTAFEAAAAQVKPAVVSVYSEKLVKMSDEGFPIPFGDDLLRQLFGKELEVPQQHAPLRPQWREHSYPQHGMGSGMILDKQGHILTNYHVVRDVDKLKVRLADKRQFDAEVVGTDPKSDVAIIRITGKVPDNLPIVKLGNSDALKVGDWVLAVGAPFGLTQTVTAGIISASGRADVGITDYEDFLQTDAAINPGNSGGPLVNIDGEVIGMNTAIATGMGQYAGVGFAIPSDMIESYLPTLIKGEGVTRGFLGVTIQDLDETLAKQFQAPDINGALVSQVNKDTPADKAGLKPGDVIIRYHGKPIENTRELRRSVAGTMPGSRVDLTILREGKQRVLTVSVGKMPSQGLAAANNSDVGPAQSSSLDKFGLTVQPLNSDQARQFGSESQHGVVISAVEPGSAADLASLQAGDLIVEADRRPVATVNELRSALSKSKDSALLLIKRKDATLFVTMRVG